MRPGSTPLSDCWTGGSAQQKFGVEEAEGSGSLQTFPPRVVAGPPGGDSLLLLQLPALLNMIGRLQFGGV